MLLIMYKKQRYLQGVLRYQEGRRPSSLQRTWTLCRQNRQIDLEMLTDEVEFYLAQEVCIPISKDIETAP